MNFDTGKLVWTRSPEQYRISPERIEITTQLHTDLRQRPYYHFRCSRDGINYRQMRLTKCMWQAHDGRQPDQEV